MSRSPKTPSAAPVDKILDRHLVTLRAPDFDRFVAILKNPPALPADIKARLLRKPVWDAK